MRFDAHLIGIDPDYRIHVSDRLLEIRDGPFLELGLKGIAGNLDRKAATEWGSPPSSAVGDPVRAIQEIGLAVQAVPHTDEAVPTRLKTDGRSFARPARSGRTHPRAVSGDFGSPVV
jgi:hypothetical protein